MTLETIVATPTHRPDVNLGAAQWVSERVFGHPDGFRDYSSVTVLRNGAVTAALVLHNWQPEAGVIEISAAGSGYWQSRRVIREVLGICFDTMGCQLAAMRASADDKASINIAHRIGFTGTRIPRWRGRDKDEMLMTISDDEWKSSRLYKSTT